MRILGYENPGTCTAPKWVPIWGPGSPWGPFSVFGSPLGPHRVTLGPHFLFLSFRTREKSVEPPSNVAYLITCKNTNYFYESHASLSVKVDFRKNSLFQWITSFRSIFQIYVVWVPISAVEGPHWVPISLEIRSPLGPHEIFLGSPCNLGAVALFRSI